MNAHTQQQHAERRRGLLHRVGVLALVGLLFAGVAPACNRNDQTVHGNGGAGSERGSAAAGPAISEELMLALAQAKNYHHKANVLVADGNPAQAIVTVRQILALRFPANAPEADDVRHDARALLAKLLASQGQLDNAMAVIAEGLASATRDSFFVANMYTVQGPFQPILPATPVQ